MNVLSLCSGIAGLDLGLKIAVPHARTVCYVERDDYCRRVLLARMSDGSLDAGPIWDDLTTFDGHPWRGVVDCVTAGFPCQDISNAGRREGIREGNRSGLWYEVARVIGEVGPGLCFLENVSALLGRGMDTVLGDLSDLGYDAVWGVVSAADVGAPQLRRRVFILAYARRECDGEDQPEPFGRRGGTAYAGALRLSLADAEGQREKLWAAEGGRSGRPTSGGSAVGNADLQRLEGTKLLGERKCQQPKRGNAGRVMGDTERQGLALGRDKRRDAGKEQSPAERAGAVSDAEELFGTSEQRIEPNGAGERIFPFPPGPADRESWAEFLRGAPHLEPAVRRGAHGFPRRMDRLRCLGNAVVPDCAAAAFRLLAGRIDD